MDVVMSDDYNDEDDFCFVENLTEDVSHTVTDPLNIFQDNF